MKLKYFGLISIVFIVAIASFLRVWQLNTHMIFFGDSAHDLLVARQAILDKELPLLGIESSLPRFRQGPVALWIIMLSQLIFGLTNTYAIALVFALISIIAVIALYELLTVFVNQKTGLISSALLAVSPMAVAHGRVPYHTTPIPLALIGFLWSLQRLWDGKKWAVFLAFFSWAVAFQFELALFPLILVPVYIFWRKKRNITRYTIGQMTAGLVTGLLPQIVFDLTHRFAHLGGFGVWIIYRIAAFGGFRGEHTISTARLQQTLTIFWSYFKKIVSLDQTNLSLLAAGVLFVSLIFIWQEYKRKKLPPLVEISTVSFLALIVAYTVHGAPSEAYFPPFLVLIPILISYALATVINKNLQTKILISGLMIGYVALIASSIIRYNFFVGTRHPYNYGPSISEYRQVIKFIAEESQNQFSLNTTTAGGHFPSYFDNMRWLQIEQGYQPVSKPHHLFYIEHQPALDSYPSIKKVSFNLLTVYQLL